MSDKWKSPSGHPVASSETDKQATPTQAAGDDLIVSSIEFIKGQIKEGKHLHADGAFFATDDGFVIRVSSVKADINARIRGEAPPAGEVPGLREAIAEKVLYEDALQYLYDFTGSKPIGSTEYQIHMYIYSIFQSAEKGEFND